MPIPPVSSPTVQPSTTTSSSNISEVTNPKLDGSSKDAAYFGSDSFQDALISETTFPKLDGSSKDAAYLKAKVTPAVTPQVDGGITASDDWETPIASKAPQKPAPAGNVTANDDWEAPNI
ncbi:MAG TPA: hypothetical protein VIG99_27745 [Myxococcaceae bacterium]